MSSAMARVSSRIFSPRGHARAEQREEADDEGDVGRHRHAPAVQAGPAPQRRGSRRTAGTTMPPSAATTGSSALRGSASSPVTSSRLISRPTTKKNSVMRPSLIACSNGRSQREPAEGEADLDVPERPRTACASGEFARTSATSVNASNTSPPDASMWRNRVSGATSRPTGEGRSSELQDVRVEIDVHHARGRDPPRPRPGRRGGGAG